MKITITETNDGREAAGTVSWENTFTQFDGNVPPHLPWPVSEALRLYINSGKTDGAKYRAKVEEE